MNAILVLMAGSVLVWLATILLSSIQMPVLNALHVISAENGQTPTTPDLIFSLAIALIILAVVRRQKIFGIIIAIILAFLTFSGLTLYIGIGLAFSIAIALLLYERLNCSFLSNDLFVFVSVLFGSLPIGISYPIEFVILILITVSVYDVIGVFLTRFIPTLARGAVEGDVPLLLFAPRNSTLWQERPTMKNTAAILGAGDVFLPAIFLSAVTFTYGIPLGVATLAGAVIGSILNLALAAAIRTGIPAIPMLAAGMLAAYFLFRP